MTSANPRAYYEGLAEQVKAELLSVGVSELAIVGCSKAEIERVQDVARRELPVAYLVFLECFGRKAGPVLADIDIFFPRILFLTAELNQRFAGYGAVELPFDDFFVHASRQGDQFGIFRMSEVSEAADYYVWSDWEPPTLEHFPRFWDLILEDLELVKRNRIPSA